MYHPETYTVTKDNGPRPAGKPDRCFYCERRIGAEHKENCVLRIKTVVIKATIEYTVSVPAHWTAEDVRFNRNQSSRCASNIIEEMKSWRER